MGVYNMTVMNSMTDSSLWLYLPQRAALLDAGEPLAHRVAVSLTAGTATLATALAVVFILIIRPRYNRLVTSEVGQGAETEILCDSQFLHLFFVSILLPALLRLLPAALW